MPNIQQPEMRRSGQTQLVQDSAGPKGGRAARGGHEHRSVPAEQTSPYGPHPGTEPAAEAPAEPSKPARSPSETTTEPSETTTEPSEAAGERSPATDRDEPGEPLV